VLQITAIGARGSPFTSLISGFSPASARRSSIAARLPPPCRITYMRRKASLYQRVLWAASRGLPSQS